MAHIHGVFDSDAHFSVDPITKTLKNESSQKTTVIQKDHNSERFTFEIPRMIEGHDMSLCNDVKVHYINIDASTKQENKGVYAVDDLQISQEDDQVVICSWLVSGNATQLKGPLSFSISYSCVTDDLDYCLNTAAYKAISVAEGVYCGEYVAEEYADILVKWEQELVNAGGVTDEQIQNAVNAYLEENPVTGGATAEQAAQIEANRKAIAELQENGTGGGGGAGLTEAQILALDGMFKAAAYTKADVSIEYATFCAAFGIENDEPDIPDQPDEPDIPDVPVVNKYTITNTLTNVTTDNPVASVTENDAYMATLTAADGYTLEGGTVTVKMGGTDITATAYANGEITIAAVTGNVVITAAAVEVQQETDEVVLLKNISFDGKSYLDTGFIPETVYNKYVFGIQAPDKTINTNRWWGGISMRDSTNPANSSYWDLVFGASTHDNSYNADMPSFKSIVDFAGLTAKWTTGSDKGDNASTQPYNNPVYYSFTNGIQSSWANEECTETPVLGHFAYNGADNKDFANQTNYTDDEHPIDTIWLGKVHVTGVMGNQYGTEANTYAGMKIYCFKAYDADGNLVLDLRPAKQGSTVGMYDNVAQKFIAAELNGGTVNYEEVA